MAGIAIAWEIIHEKIVSASVQTITRYARNLGLTKALVVPKKRRYDPSIRATKPNEVWHVDITMVRNQDNQKAAVSFVGDNYSRKILAYHIAPKVSWQSTVEVLKKARNQSRIVTSSPSVLLVSDGGSENDNQYIKSYTRISGIRHVIAQQEVSFSNSMVEACNKTIKYR